MYEWINRVSPLSPTSADPLDLIFIFFHPHLCPLLFRSLDFFECQEWINNRTAEVMDSLAARVLVYDTENLLFTCMMVRSCCFCTRGKGLCYVGLRFSKLLAPAAHKLMYDTEDLLCLSMMLRYGMVPMDACLDCAR